MHNVFNGVYICTEVCSNAKFKCFFFYAKRHAALENTGYITTHQLEVFTGGCKVANTLLCNDDVCS